METNIQNLITSKNNTGYIHHEGKQVKITVKELSKNTTACEACRAAKKKCNGLSPCSRCVLKKQECVFTTLQKRRGPDKDRKRKREETPAAVIDTETPPTSLNTARMECQMLDIVEAGTLDNFYGNFVKMVFPLTIHNLLHPTSTAQQVQSYTALAYIARISGVPDIARKYISQARVISGDIYDCFDADAVSAMLVFSYYWGLDNNTKLSQFYYGVACGLADEVPPSMLKGSVGVLSGLKKILGNQYYSYKQKGQIMKEATNKYMWDPSINDIISREFMFFSSDFIAFCNFCPIIQGGYAGVMEKKFQIFDNLTLSEEDRLQVHRSIDLIQQAVDKCLDIYKSPQIQAFYEFELPMYRALIEFASGHTLEALNYAFLSSKGLNKLLEGQSLGALSDISMLLLMGSCARLLNRHGQYNLAKNIIDVVKQVCKLMEPALNFILTDIDLITQAVPVLQPSTYPNMISNPNFAIFPNSSFSFTSTTINSSSSIPHEISVTNTFVSTHSPLLNQLSSSPSSSFVFSPTEQNNLLNNFSPQHSIPFDDIPLLSNDLTILSHLESPRIEEL